MENVLIVVEGKDLEKTLVTNIAETFLKDYTVVTAIYDELKNVDLSSYFVAENKNSRVFIVKPAKNQLAKLMKNKKDDEDFCINTLYLNVDSDYFSRTFLIFDCDYCKKDILEKALKTFKDVYTEGLLIISSPCIESISDFVNLKYSLDKGKHLSKTYKHEVGDQLKREGILNKGLALPTTTIKNYFYECCYYHYCKDCSKYKTNDVYEILNNFIERDLPTTIGGFYKYNYITSFMYLFIFELCLYKHKDADCYSLVSALKANFLGDEISKKIISKKRFVRY